MVKVRIYPYKIWSRSAKILANGLNATRIRANSIIGYNPVINWGNTNMPTWRNRIINHPDNVALAVDKIACLRTLKEHNVNCLDYTTNKQEAKQWLDSGHMVLARKLISSHSGAGIVIVNPEDYLIDARLYTKYKRKRNEYRVFVMKDRIVDYSMKRRVENWEDLPNFNKYIRNYCNGWVFCRDNINLSDKAKEISINAIRALGLDFGAVEIGETKNGECFVIEVNTAPSLDGITTRDRITRAFIEETRLW